MMKRRGLCTTRTIVGALVLTMGAITTSTIAQEIGLADGSKNSFKINQGQNNTGHDCPNTVVDEDGAVHLTQNDNIFQDDENSVACQGAGTTPNGWARCFDLVAEGINGDLNIDVVYFGIQQATIEDILINVNLYISNVGCDLDPGAPPDAQATLVATGSRLVGPADELGSLKPVFFTDVLIPAGSILIIEIESPGDGNIDPPWFFRPRSNFRGQCGSTYLRAVACGIPGWIALDAIGFPDNHVVIKCFGQEKEPAVPEGDTCDDCIPVGEGVFSGTTSDNSAEPDITSCTFNDTVTEWYCYTASCDGTATVSTCAGANYDTALSAWDSCPGGGGEQSDCCIPHDTPGCDDQACQDVVCAADPFCCNQEWDGLCVGGAEELCGDLCEGGGGGANEIACNDDACGLQSTITFPVVAGGTYYIRVSGFNGQSGDYTLEISCQEPQPSGCSNCTELSDGITFGSTIGAPSEDDINSCTFGGPSATETVWYCYTASCDGVVNMDTCGPGTDYDTVLGAWSACPEDGGVQLACNDDACPGFKSEIAFPVSAGVTYFIRVSGFANSEGNFELNVSCGGPGEACDCPDGALEEGEVCGSDTNGGCNSSPNVFTDASCGDTFCGNAWADGGTRDTDWYLVSVDDPDGDGLAVITGTLFSEFNGVVFIVDGIANCAPVVAGVTGASADCKSQGAASAVVSAPGTYVVFVANGGFDGNPCGLGNSYTLEITCEDDGGGGGPGHPECNANAGDCCVPNGTPGCNDEDCCNLVCDMDPFCCNTEWDSICAAEADKFCGICDVSPPCPWDLDGDGNIGTSDLLILFSQWGLAGSADFDGSGDVGTADLLILFANWGPCP